MHMHAMSNHTMDMGGMTMYFHFGYNEDNVLFGFWEIKSILGACAPEQDRTQSVRAVPMCLTHPRISRPNLAYPAMLTCSTATVYVVHFRRIGHVRRTESGACTLVVECARACTVRSSKARLRVVVVCVPHTRGVMLLDIAVRRSAYDQTLSEQSTRRFQFRCVCTGASRVQRRRLSPTHLTQAVMYGAQVTLGMMLMLVWMTYNVWLCAAMVGGAIVGYILFGHTPTPTNADRLGQTTICH